ncbi:LuxR C-terminal-related transcriptional regulator [Actinophytocola sp.]|uniref:helix-turn-helix transcriptional regulator n=1 Tax=Actinophytocola sp. TaxID=1872138 RepID=UPI003D6BFB10
MSVTTMHTLRHAVPASAGVEELLASATAEVRVMSGLAGPRPIGAPRRIDRENVRRGVRYRIVVPDSARTEPAFAPRLGELSLAGADVRTVAEVPTDALVIDGSVVVLPVVRTASGPSTGTAVFRLPSVVTTTTELFDRVWLGGVPLVPGDLPESAERQARERALMALLLAGYTDESAAAQLKISVRTVRRTVADMMNRLGARSRFQLGAKAADSGMLMELAG